MNEHHEKSGLLPESKCGLGTIDMIFPARQLQEKCQEQNVDLYITFVDLTKAFDTVSHEGLWKVMAKFGCPAKLISIVRPSHNGMLYVYSTRRFVLCLTLCYFVLVFFSPFSIAITSLGEDRANLSAFRSFVRFVLVWICRFSLPLGVWEGLRFVTVALPGLFSYLFFLNIEKT